VATKRLRVSCEPAFAARWLVPRLGGFSAAHPQIELELDASNEIRTLGRDADLAIRYLFEGSRRARSRSRLLFAIEGIAVVAGVRPKPAPWRHDDAVVGYRLLHDDDGRAWRQWFDSAGLDGFDHAKHLFFNDYSLALAAALRGQGAVLGTAMFIEADLTAGRLAQIGHTRIPFGEYFLLEASERSTAPVRRAFVRWLEGEIARSAAATVTDGG